jgi:hypothetical protein
MFIAALLSALTAGAQSIICLQPSCKQTAFALDSPRIFAQLSSSDTIKGISFAQIAGPGKAVLSSYLVTGSPFLQVASEQVTASVPGLYIFQVSASTRSGVAPPQNDSLMIKPPLIPRTVVGITSKLVNGVWVDTFLYSDGTTQ